MSTEALLPFAGDQFMDVVSRVGVDAHQHVLQISEWIDASKLAGHHYAEQDGGVLRAVFAPGEKPVLTAEDQLFSLAFRVIIVDRQKGDLRVRAQCLEVVQRVRELTMLNRLRNEELSCMLPSWVSRPWLPMVRQGQEVNHGD